MHYADQAAETIAVRNRTARWQPQPVNPAPMERRGIRRRAKAEYDLNTVTGRRAYLAAMEAAAGDWDIDLEAVCIEMGTEAVLGVLRLAKAENMTPEQALKYLLETSPNWSVCFG